MSEVVRTASGRQDHYEYVCIMGEGVSDAAEEWLQKKLTKEGLTVEKDGKYLLVTAPSRQVSA